MNEPWQIPKSWAWVESREIAEIVGGGTPRTDDPANFDEGDVPWITPADLSGYKDKYISRGARNITRKGLDNSGARLMPEGAVLFSSRAPIGYVAIASNPVSTNQGFKSFVLRPFIKPDYAYYYLQKAKDLAVELSSGTTFREISGAKAALIPFPVAPVAEQERIVAEIEKQFTRLDAAVAALKRVQANLKRYRAAVLKAACEGRLVPTEAELARREGRSYEPASVLLKRILAERRSRWEVDQIAKFKRSGKIPSANTWKERYPEPDALYVLPTDCLPEGWDWATIDRISFVIRGASPRPAGDPKYFGGKIPWITVGSLTADETPYLHSVAETVTEAGKVASRFIEPETLLLTNSGATLGVPKITLIGGCINDGSVALLYLDYPTKLYLYYFLKSQTRKLRLINQGAAQPNLNTTIVRGIVVPMPPIVEQQRIVDVLQRRFSMINGVEKEIESELSRAERLRQSILKQAFEGKLLPQDPNDEPASVLLERIREDRIAAQKCVSTAPRRARKREVAHVA